MDNKAARLLEQWEERCFEDPELEEHYDDLVMWRRLHDEVDTSLLVAELEYGDGNVETPKDIFEELRRNLDDFKF